MIQGRIKLLFVYSVVLCGLANIAIADEPEAVPGEFIVKYKHAVKVQNDFSIQSVNGGEVKRVIPEMNMAVIKRPMLERADFAVESLSQDPNIEYIEPNYIYHATRAPNDSDLSYLWGMNNVGQSAGVAGIDIQAEKAWDITTGSRNVIVAIIDTGIDYTHPDLKNNMWYNQAEAKGKAGVDDDKNGFVDDVYGVNFSDPDHPKANAYDDAGHGSHCAGTIGGSGNDGRGVVGVNWQVRMMPVKFLSSSGSGSTEGAILAINYAVKMGAKILSNSWGGGAYSQALLEAVQAANKAGVLFVVAAGNDSNNNDKHPTYPSSLNSPNVLSVAAVDNRGNLASFSNYGKKSVHVGAPGVNIFSSTPHGKYETMSGTSMATPHVSGIAALLLAHEPGLSVSQIKGRIISTARGLRSLTNTTKSGGIASAYGALVNKKLALQE